ncbi:MAG: sulfurtransferase complex subunit TusB [Proteobacteria bacterium]|nr:MAG: sulfurtransferase complex subunit TusB [Pseudomonadota bacterium]QKK12734.1 MAG: sulfurtransferase complex subunit TusB [Pseudomonadota bacterium]
MLHVINKSPFERNSLASCLRTIKEGASVLLIEDGVLGALEGTAVSGKVREAMENVKFYALQSDLETRGVSDKLMKGIECIDFGGFVDLTADHDLVQSWL